ncbi:LTA synthase family protein [Bengtsoniella intestinalis]|uniref:LTA synthase family protein n=1 Tax=Bengtsoniella intestinalis TaxID=3073143 RepID=UPI00391FAD66
MTRYTARRRFPHITLPHWVSFVLAILLTGLITLVSIWCQPNSFIGVISGFLDQPLLIVLNALPVGLVVLVFGFLCYNVFDGAAIATLLVGGFSIANRIKLDVRNEPVYLRDLTLLKEASAATSSYAINYPIAAFVVVFGLIIAFVVLGRICKPTPASSLKQSLVRRVLGSVASAAVLVGLTLTVYASNDLYNGFTVSNPYYVPSVFNELGFPYCFTHHATTYSVDKPDGFSQSEAAAWETGDSTGNGQTVNVIFVMNEAYSAITEQSVFTYSDETDPMKNFHALENDTYVISGDMVVPGFAGGTANTEFDVMTGMQTNALSATTTSAFRAFNRDVDSLFSVFGNDGYYTSYTHPGDCWFYNRENVLDLLGADDTTFVESMYDDATYKGRWITDDYSADLIIDELNSAIDSDTPLFHYHTTIQNHMSYTLDKYGEDYPYGELETTAIFDEEIETLLKVYIEGIRDADAMLQKLVDDFSAKDEPVILVFYGDHLPYIGDNRSGYTAMGLDYALDETQQENPLAGYTVPYLIWGNEAAGTLLDWDNTVANLDVPETISASFLGSMVLELTGRGDDSPWFDFLGELRREYPVVQNQWVLSTDGTLTQGEDDDAQAWIDQWRDWSYYKLKYKDMD